MAGKILGIDIQSDSIAAVQVEGGLRGYRVTGCARVMMGDVDGLDEAFKALSEQVDFKADTYISTIPGEQVSYRNLQMPFQSTKKVRQTIAYEIEPMIPFSVEDLVVDFTSINQSGRSDILTASVKKEYISKYLALLQNHGVDPDILDISGVPMVLWLFRQGEIPDDGILFQIGQKRTTMVLYIKRHISLVRSFTFCDDLITEAISNSPAYGNVQSQAAEPIVSCFRSLCTNVQNTLHAFEYQNDTEAQPEKIFVTGTGNLYPHTVGLLERFFDIPVEEINLVDGDPSIHLDTNIAQSWNSAIMDSALALALRGNKQGLSFNFRKDEFEIKRKDTKLRKDIQRVAVFLMVILSLLITYFGMYHYFLK